MKSKVILPRKTASYLTALMLIVHLTGVQAQEVVFSDATSDYPGWQEGGDIVENNEATAYEGTEYRAFSFQLGESNWSGFAWNVNNWGEQPPLDVSSYSHISLAYMFSEPGFEISVSFRTGSHGDEPTSNAVSDISTTSEWKLLQIPLSSYDPFYQDMIIDVTIGVSATDGANTGILFIDDVKFVSDPVGVTARTHSLFTPSDALIARQNANVAVQVFDISGRLISHKNVKVNAGQSVAVPSLVKNNAMHIVHISGAGITAQFVSNGALKP